jgi:large subunit ribosomal protein L25
MITIEATKRDVKVNPKHMRKDGKMPAVFYGKGVESTPITVETSLFVKALREAGESTVVTLSVEGKKMSVLIHDTVRHAVRGDFMHADFLVVPMNEAIEVDVPVVFTGEAPAAKLGAVIVKVLHEVTVSALPADLPHEITVDLGGLTEIHSTIKVSDLKLGKGIKIISDASEIIVSATEAEKEEVVGAATEVAA